MYNFDIDGILEMLNLSTMQHNTRQCNTRDHNATQHNIMDYNTTQCNTTDATQENSPQHNKTGNKNHAHMLNKPVEVTSSLTKNSTEKKRSKNAAGIVAEIYKCNFSMRFLFNIERLLWPI